jgi:hypothetical protein
MTPGKLNFVCPQGSTFSRTLTYKLDDDPVNLTGYGARLQVREFHYSNDYMLGIDSGSSSANIYTGGSAGTININISASTTKEFVPGNYVYDLEIYTTSNVYRLVEGKFTVTAEVTR